MVYVRATVAVAGGAWMQVVLASVSVLEGGGRFMCGRASFSKALHVD